MNLSIIFRQIILFALIVLAASCGSSTEDVSHISLQVPGVDETPERNQKKAETLLDLISKKKKLIILTINAPTTYYIDRDNNLAGLEYEMTQSLAEYIGVDVEYRVYASTRDVIKALRNNEGHIAAAGLTVNDKRKQEFDFGPVYQSTDEYLVCHRTRGPIRTKQAFRDVEIIVAADSNYIETLKGYPEASWAVDADMHTTKLLEQVSDKKIECTVSDSNLYDIEKRYLTEIQNKHTLNKQSDLAWMLNKHSEELLKQVNDWFTQFQDQGELPQVLDKYYGYVEIFDYVDIHKFLKRVNTRLPKYKEFFIDAAQKNGIEPSLLAAQSYQESHWDRKAKSPTGVRGIMMLTQPVAKSLGVTNRLDAEQNIYAGAEFHAKMKKMVKHVDEPDRTWLALAAYNVGRGHFRDAQQLARKLGKNPDRWADMKDVLPLLSDKKYYKDLRYGYARGSEPVDYVTRIRSYNELLLKHFGREKFDGVK